MLIPKVELVELIALAGFDLVIFDLEHGPYGVETLPSLIAAAEASSLLSVVRVADANHHGIGAALDAGADGVLVPHISSPSAAAAAVRAARFAPAGTRGANPYVRAAGYSAHSSYLVDANDLVTCIAMVEGRQGLASVDQISETPGLDGIFVGPIDLSVDLGLAGQVDSKPVVDAVARVIRSTLARGLIPGVFAATPTAARRWFELGAGLVALSVDSALILSGLTDAATHVRVGKENITGDAASAPEPNAPFTRLDYDTMTPSSMP